MPSIILSRFSQAFDSACRALSDLQHWNSTRSQRRTWRNDFHDPFALNPLSTSGGPPQGVEHLECAPLTLSLSSEGLLDAIEEMLRPSLDTILVSVLPATPPSPSLAQRASEAGPPQQPVHLTVHCESNYLEVPIRSLSTSSLGVSASSTPSEGCHFADASSLRESFVYPDTVLDRHIPLQDMDYDCSTTLTSDAKDVTGEASRPQNAMLLALDSLPQEMFDYILCLAFGCVDGFEVWDLDLLLTRRARARAVSKQWKESIDNLIQCQFLAIPKDFLPYGQSQTTNVADEAWLAELLARGGTFEAVSFRFSNRFIDSSLTNHPRHSQLMKAAAESTRRLWLYVDLSPATPLPEAEPFGRTSLDSSNLRHLTWISPSTGIHNHLPEDCCFPWRNLKEDLSWTHLTHLELICPLSINDVRFALSQSMHLISLRATLWFGGPVATGQTPIVCPSLRELAISSTVAFEDMFVGVDMGSLTNLSLSFPKDESSLLLSAGPVWTFNPAIDVPWERLRDLSIDYHRSEEFPLSAVLARARSTRRLALNGRSDRFICDTFPGSGQALESLALGPDLTDVAALARLFHGTEIPILSTSTIHLNPLSLPRTAELRCSQTVSPQGLFKLLRAIHGIARAHFTVADGPLPHSVVATSLVALTLILTSCDLDPITDLITGREEKDTPPFELRILPHVDRN